MTRFLATSFGIFFSLSVISNANAQTPTPTPTQAPNACSSRAVASLAKALGAREAAGQAKDAAKAYLDLEKEHQSRLAAGLEEAHAKAAEVPASYVQSVKAAMTEAINKAYEKEKSSLAKKSASAISSRQRAYDKAANALSKAQGKVPTLTCTY